MKTRYQALVLAAILSASVILSYFFMKPSYYPIVDFNRTTYISGKYLNITSFEYPQVWQHDDAYVGRIWLGV